MTTVLLVILIVFALEAADLSRLRVLVAPRFLLALWRVYVVFPWKRRKPCSFAGCNRQRCEYDGRIERWCEFHHRDVHEHYGQPLGGLR